MDKRSQLYYALTEYIAGNYDTVTFCSVFYDIFYPDTPKQELSEFEYAEFERLAYATTRFSQYEEDLVNYPKAYVSAKEIAEIASQVHKNLCLSQK